MIYELISNNIVAIQYKGYNKSSIEVFCSKNLGEYISAYKNYLILPTKRGILHIYPDDYIIKYIDNNFSIMSANTFKSLYKKL